MVVAQDLLEEAVRFFEHRVLEELVEFRVEDLVRRREVDVAQVEPLAEEVLGQPFCLRIVQQPFHLRAQHRGSAELAFARQLEEPVVGSRAPQEVGQAGSQREVVEAAAGFLAEEEAVGTENRF